MKLKDRTLLTDKCFVGGVWKGTSIDPVMNPATGEVIARSPIGSAADVTAAIDAASAAFPATPAWVKQDNGHTLTFEQGAFTCDGRGHLFLRANGQPALEIGLFLWHGAWICESLEGGKVEAADLQTDGALRLRGLWGTRDGAAPLRYALTLTPGKDSVAARLEVEKTGDLKLSDGIWASVRTAVAADDARIVYLLPSGNAPVGKSIDHV